MMLDSRDAEVSEPATIARIEFDAIILCRDAVSSGLVASSYTVHQYLSRAVAQKTQLTR